MQLESFASGAESAKLAKKNSSNLVPKANEEYLYFRFKITYHSGTQTIKAKDVFITTTISSEQTLQNR